ncbi:MAG: MATE family efflux transporter [Moraxellaceae bacterium]|nr:MAG: MATE family efflux transporter [Moraxellaceae bacterium]
MMLSNITVPLLGLVDTAVLGHLEHSGYLAGVAIGGSIFTFVFWAFGFLRMGTTGLISQANGQQDQPLLLRTILQSIGLGFAIGLILIANQGWLLTSAITLIDGSAQAQALALTYCQIRIWGAPATLMQYALIGAFIGLQKPKASLMVLVCINSLNIAFDIGFVVVLDMNVVGVALATIIAEYCGLALSLLYLFYVTKNQFNTSSLTTAEFYRSSLRNIFNRSELARFFTVNIDIFIRTCCLLFVFAFFTSQGAKQGDVILAANAVLLTFLLLISNTLDGFANAAEATVGNFIGSNRQNQLAAFVRAALQWCIVSTALLMLIFWLSGPFIIALLTNIIPVQETANNYLSWLIVMPALACLSYLYDGVFIGATETRAMRNIMAICLFGIFLPLWAITKIYGNHGLWFSMSAFMLGRSLLMHIAYRRFLTKQALNTASKSS